jgi:hypothetical protein
MLLVLEQLKYELDPLKFDPGRSFFLPCLAPAKARILVERYMRNAKLRVFVKISIEDGVSGLRVWRIC